MSSTEICGLFNFWCNADQKIWSILINNVLVRIQIGMEKTQHGSDFDSKELNSDRMCPAMLVSGLY